MTNRNIDSALSLAILGLLSSQALSGYDLRKVFTATAMKHFSASPGAIYPALRRLEAAGLIRGEVEKQDTLRPRKVYRLTPAGLELLKTFLSQPVREEDIIWRMDELALRFTFMCELVGKEKTLIFLREYLSQTEAYVRVLENELKVLEKDMPFCARASFEQGLETYRANARWAKKVIREFERQGGER